MKTIIEEKTLYKFDELSEESKERAVENLHDINDESIRYLYDEAYESVKKFCKHFPALEGNISWLDLRVNLEEEILDLKGIRLRTYIINNFGHVLYAPKYYGKLSEYDKHGNKIEKSKDHPNGVRHIKRYSKCQIQAKNGNLTGVCWDEVLLKPFYDFIEYEYKNDHIDLEMLLTDAQQELDNSLQSMEEFYTGYEGIVETIEMNDYDFTEDGDLY